MLLDIVIDMTQLICFLIIWRSMTSGWNKTRNHRQETNILQKIAHRNNTHHPCPSQHQRSVFEKRLCYFCNITNDEVGLYEFHNNIPYVVMLVPIVSLESLLYIDAILSVWFYNVMMTHNIKKIYGEFNFDQKLAPKTHFDRTVLLKYERGWKIWSLNVISSKTFSSLYSTVQSNDILHIGNHFPFLSTLKGSMYPVLHQNGHKGCVYCYKMCQNKSVLELLKKKDTLSWQLIYF